MHFSSNGGRRALGGGFRRAQIAWPHVPVMEPCERHAGAQRPEPLRAVAGIDPAVDPRRDRGTVDVEVVGHFRTETPATRTDFRIRPPISPFMPTPPHD